MNFTLSTEQKWHAVECQITIEDYKWKEWRAYCSSQKMVNNRMYGFDFAECEELWLISPFHLQNFYNWAVWNDPARVFYNSLS